MVKVSREFKARLKLAERPAYRIATEAGVNPSTLSKIIHDAEPIQVGDERVLKVARVLGMSDHEAFESEA
jgi:plasmid maintenance system antidote protein VapI